MIDKKKDQGRIGDAFARIHKALDDKDLSLTWFDFHGECAKMKWENLSKLVDEVKDKLKQFGSFAATITLGSDSSLPRTRKY